jgi:hypothetical protein
MGKQSLANAETTALEEGQQIELLNTAEPVRYGKQSNLDSVLIIRFLAIFFCLAFWYGVYKLINYVFLSG